MTLFLLACTQPKEPADTAPTPTDSDTDTDTVTDDTGEPVDTAVALQPPDTFLEDVGFLFTDMAIVGPYACAVTSVGRVFCWTKGGRVCSQPPVDLQAREVTVTGDASYSACALETGSGDAVCWTRDGTLSRTEGPFLTLSGSCGIRAEGEIECWEDFGVCPAREPEGTFIALDARQYGTAVRSDGAVVTWSGPCLEWGGSDDYPTCLDCPDGVEVAGPFVAASNASRGGVCAAYAAGGIYCDTLDAELEAGAPATGEFVDLDSASWWGAAGACALDTNGVTTCWGDDVASSTPFVDIESGRLDAVYGLTPEGTIEEFDAAYPDDDWVPCDPAVE